MNKHTKPCHGDRAVEYACANCESTLQTKYIITVNGEPKSICKNSSCVARKPASMSKGVVVNVKPA